MTTTRDIDAETLAAILIETAAGKDGRILAAVSGPPGVGKSTTTGHLVERLNETKPGIAAILAMDGYHFDDAVLNARGHRPRKGAPFTFDLGGLAATIGRLKQDDGSDVAVPVFDRDLEIARAGGRIIDGQVRIIVCEGNYLLLDEPGWRDLKPLFDVTVSLLASEAVLEARLLARWQGYGLAGETMRTKMEGNDLPNMRLVLRNSRPADYSLRTDAI